MKAYDHKKIEKKWQDIWEKKKIYQAKNFSKKPKYYVLDMFPYPSGMGLHVGHPKGYIGSDVFARMKRMQGFNVLHPMGYDAFGLPAEQYALEHNIHPRQAVIDNIKTFKKQLSIIGLSYDWEREVDTTDPNYYRWTQWIFLKLYGSWYNKDKNKAEPIGSLIKILEKKGDWKLKSEKEKQDILMQYRLAYEGYGEVNWCPKLGTVLANDEVVDGKNGPVSERGGFPVEKKSMRQWFLRITAYADRLLTGLEGLDWSTHIKEIQKNWIGRSEGAEIEFEIATQAHKNSSGLTLPGVPGGTHTVQNSSVPASLKVKVFTTRPDTIFGATYVVLAPEHALVSKLKSKIKNWNEVGNYIKKAKKETEIERTAEDKIKTGVELKGVKAINPATKEEIPIWIADYVLANYGTGAIMAVPAHDERDFEFAKKFKLPIKRVVEQKFVAEDGDGAVRKNLPFVKRNAICAVVVNPKNGKYLCVSWKKFLMHGFVTGGIEESEDITKAALREIYEETGYKNVKLVRNPNVAIHTFFYHRVKEQNRWARFQYLFFELIDEEQDPIKKEESDLHNIIWKSKNELEDFFSVAEGKFVLNILDNRDYIFTGEGILHDSGKFNGMDSEKAKKEITKFVGGKIVVNYKMRDAIFARQRYWGEPIPLIHDKDGLIHEVPDKKLPLKLPNVKSYRPTNTGESPLAGVLAWVKKGYETNTMPGWAGSSWYFLRYMDPKNKKVFAGKKAIQYWKNIDMYVGGQEHATGHLLYSRFWYKFLKDYGLVVTEEPFKSLRNQGMILGRDNRKMSKRWGNVVNPDDIVKTYGADTLRIYEMFMGPFEQSAAWSDESIIGPRRFLEKVWRVGEKVLKSKNSSGLTLPGVPGGAHTVQNSLISKLLHKTIKKVSEDIEEMHFNTAISALMILATEMEKAENISIDDYKKFLQILAPFAPHIADELWNRLGEKWTINLSSWPKWSPDLIKDEEIKIAVQVDGKVRAEIIIGAEDDEEEVKKKALKNQAVLRHLAGRVIKKAIYVKNRLINII